MTQPLQKREDTLLMPMVIEQQSNFSKNDMLFNQTQPVEIDDLNSDMKGMDSRKGLERTRKAILPISVSSSVESSDFKKQ